MDAEITVPSPVSQGRVQVPKLEVAIEQDSRKRLGLDPKQAVTVKPVTLGDAIVIPFSNYQAGSYYVSEVRQPDKSLQTRLYYSRSGEYIGALQVIDKAHHEFRATESGDQQYSRIYRANARDDIHLTFLREELKGTTNSRLYDKMVPTYEVRAGALTNQKTIKTTFGGDGEHVFCDRGSGLFFVVKEEALNAKGAVASRVGELHHCGDPKIRGYMEGGKHWFVRAEVKDGKISPVFDGTDESADRQKDWARLKEILPRAVQGAPIRR